MQSRGWQCTVLLELINGILKPVLSIDLSLHRSSIVMILTIPSERASLLNGELVSTDLSFRDLSSQVETVSSWPLSTSHWIQLHFATRRDNFTLILHSVRLCIRSTRSSIWHSPANVHVFGIIIYVCLSLQEHEEKTTSILLVIAMALGTNCDVNAVSRKSFCSDIQLHFCFTIISCRYTHQLALSVHLFFVQ